MSWTVIPALRPFVWGIRIPQVEADGVAHRGKCGEAPRQVGEAGQLARGGIERQPVISPPLAMAPTSPVRQAPGPTSRNVRTPAASIASTCRTHSTGRRAVQRAGLGRRRIVGVEAAGRVGVDRLAGRHRFGVERARSGVQAAAIVGVWNAAATSRRTLPIPCCRTRLHSLVDLAFDPERTVCVGAFLLASVSESSPRTSGCRPHPP